MMYGQKNITQCTLVGFMVLSVGPTQWQYSTFMVLSAGPTQWQYSTFMMLSVGPTQWQYSTFMVLSVGPTQWQYSTFMVLSVGPTQWQFCHKCCANFDLLLVYLKLWKSSENFIRNDLLLFGVSRYARCKTWLVSAPFRFLKFTFHFM